MIIAKILTERKKIVAQLLHPTLSKRCKQQVMISVIQHHLRSDRRVTDHLLVKVMQVIKRHKGCDVMRKMKAKSARRHKQAIKPCRPHFAREHHRRNIGITVNDRVLCIAPHKETEVAPGCSRDQPIQNKYLCRVKSRKQPAENN